LPTSSVVGRVAALVALVAALVAVGILLLGGGGSYKVTAEFENASQLVGGEQVVVGGIPAGSVEEIALGDDGQALVTFTVSDEYAPLPAETTATVRSYSLSGIANRQVQLTLPASGQASGDQIADGGVLDSSQTVSEVDLDQIFNTLDDRTVANLKKVIRGFELSYRGVGEQANRGFRYLNPFLSTSRRLFAELTHDTRAFERLIVDASRLSGALAQRSPDISELVHNLNLMMGAIGRQKEALAEAVAGLPDFMRRFNTTAVNLRATLDDLDPLIEESMPVAERLGPFFSELRAAAADAVPTVRDLDRIIKRKRPDNDLVDLTRLQVPLAEIAVGPVRRNGAERRGAFPESVRALEDSLTNLEFFRAYTPELVGWFNDFAYSGAYDANGSYGRQPPLFNAFTFSTPGFPQLFAPPLTPEQTFAGLDTNNTKRCPGANERNPGDDSTPFTANGTLDCDPSQVPVGP
jgi:phospholipid/cholesterol/gamma-HCH transport system substrate-binding protein